MKGEIPRNRGYRTRQQQHFLKIAAHDYARYRHELQTKCSCKARFRATLASLGGADATLSGRPPAAQVEAGPADGGSCALPRGTGWQCQDAEQPAVLQQPARVLGEVEAQRRIGRVGADQQQKGLPAGRPGRDPPDQVGTPHAGVLGDQLGQLVPGDGIQSRAGPAIALRIAFGFLLDSPGRLPQAGGARRRAVRAFVLACFGGEIQQK